MYAKSKLSLFLVLYNVACAMCRTHCVKLSHSPTSGSWQGRAGSRGGWGYKAAWVLGNVR